MAAYSLALRHKVLADCDAGMTTKQVAERYGVSRTRVRSLKQRRRETGEIAARIPKVGRKPKFDRARLAELVAAQPDATLVELRERLGVRCALSAICVALQKLKLTYKKSRSTRPSRSGRTWRRSGPPGG